MLTLYSPSTSTSFHPSTPSHSHPHMLTAPMSSALALRPDHYTSPSYPPNPYLSLLPPPSMALTTTSAFASSSAMPFEYRSGSQGVIGLTHPSGSTAMVAYESKSEATETKFDWPTISVGKKKVENNRPHKEGINLKHCREYREKLTIELRKEKLNNIKKHKRFEADKLMDKFSVSSSAMTLPTPQSAVTLPTSQSTLTLPTSQSAVTLPTPQPLSMPVSVFTTAPISSPSALVTTSISPIISPITLSMLPTPTTSSLSAFPISTALSTSPISTALSASPISTALSASPISTALSTSPSIGGVSSGSALSIGRVPVEFKEELNSGLTRVPRGISGAVDVDRIERGYSLLCSSDKAQQIVGAIEIRKMVSLDRPSDELNPTFDAIIKHGVIDRLMDLLYEMKERALSIHDRDPMKKSIHDRDPMKPSIHDRDSKTQSIHDRDSKTQLMYDSDPLKQSMIDCELQYNILWIITNICSSSTTKEFTRKTIEKGAVPVLMEMMSFDDWKIVGQAAWALHNITSDYREMMIDYKMLQRIWDVCSRVVNSGLIVSRRPSESVDMSSSIMEIDDKFDIEVIRKLASIVTSLCSSKPKHTYSLRMTTEEFKSRLLVMISYFMTFDDAEVLEEVSKTFKGLTEDFDRDGKDHETRMAILASDSDFCKSMIGLLNCRDRLVRAARRSGDIGDDAVKQATRSANLISSNMCSTFGQLMSSNDNTVTDKMLSINILPHLNLLLYSTDISVRKNACFALSNITAGTLRQIGQVLLYMPTPLPSGGEKKIRERKVDQPIMRRIINIIESDKDCVKIEAVWAFSNVTEDGNSDFIDYLISLDCIPALCNCLDMRETKVVMNVLNVFSRILAHVKIKGDDQLKRITEKIEECRGSEMMETLSTDTEVDSDIADAASKLLKNYFNNVAEE